jgi:molecular chaperone GrpE
MSELKAEEGNQVGEREAEMVEALPVEDPDQAPDPHSLGLELPDDPEEAVKALLRELAVARDEATSYLDDLKRVAADFDNYRKRSMRENAATVDRAAERVVRNLMPVLDTFDAALATEPKTDTERQLYSGLIGTREQLLKALEAEGLEVVPTIGERFDPEVHEPVGAPGGSGELIVSEELRRGYTLKGKVLRAALVALEVKE